MGHPQKILFIIITFFLFALWQSSFFMHFNLFGAAPNLVFVLFFLLIFFNRNIKNYQIVCLSFAGIFLDILSYIYNIGTSILIFTIVGLLFKGTRLLLRNTNDDYPFAYFLPLFLVFFCVYDALLMAYLRFFDFSHAIIGFDFKLLAQVVYSLFFAVIGFWFFKKYVKEI